MTEQEYMIVVMEGESDYPGVQKIIVPFLKRDYLTVALYADQFAHEHGLERGKQVQVAPVERW